jgi:hypothetical protein
MAFFPDKAGVHKGACDNGGNSGSVKRELPVTANIDWRRKNPERLQ